MIHFFSHVSGSVYAVQVDAPLNEESIQKLNWLFGNAQSLSNQELSGNYLGPRAAMITPWSTNAVEITQNMGVSGITRIELFEKQEEGASFDPMISEAYEGLDQEIYTVSVTPEAVAQINDIAAYNKQEGLSLSDDEVQYLSDLSNKLGRPLTDSEVFGFSQVNSEHCRHKIFNGTFIIDGEEMPESLFALIKKTSKANPNEIVSAYKDNVAFIKGPKVEQFAPTHPDVPSYYETKEFESVISLKAETHNFPTTVEPFNGAATGSGGEIRDRLAGGQGSIPMAGTALYMTSYSRLADNRPWEQAMDERKWLYQTPMDILIKASNGASDFGNKFGQPLICGSLLTFEHSEETQALGFDKVIMQAGGIGYGKAEQALKKEPKAGDDIVILGGDNYRIGMGGAAVSSADTGALGSGIELNAIQRSNPEMQKRAANTVRALVELDENPIVSIHDHGAGGHLNCLSELVEDTGGKINLEKLPIGDPTLSSKEIIGNESQERMGLVISEKDIDLLGRIAERERSPMYQVGKVTGDHRFTFEDQNAQNPMDLALSDMFGSSPKTIMEDKELDRTYKPLSYHGEEFKYYIEDVLRLEAVACKDWLTNKVDRCVGGKVAKQQCVGPLQLPLNDVAVMALDYSGVQGIATSMGHAPVSGLINAAAGARNAIAEALTNLVWAPLEKGIKSVSLSANWMWPCKYEGEDARLYSAVEAVSDFAIGLGINVPTGKDSLSMAQKYGDKTVLAPGTVVISSAAHCDDITKIVEPVLQIDKGAIYYIDMSSDILKLGGSSFAQTRTAIGDKTPDIFNAKEFARKFQVVQNAIKLDMIAAGHDISAGGMITTILEMCFADPNIGANVNLSGLGGGDLVKTLFAENAGLIIQADSEKLENYLEQEEVDFVKIGSVTSSPILELTYNNQKENLDIARYRDVWYETSFLLDSKQTAGDLAKARFDNYKVQPLTYSFPKNWSGKLSNRNEISSRPKAAILREKGSNSEREMANALFQAGFDVKDVHMTDLISGRETLEDIQFLGAVGGFSNSDVLGSAKGWAGAIKYNDKARKAIMNFFAREDTLSVGICNGCQLFLELDLINPEQSNDQPSRMTYNDSHKHESSFTSVTVGENNSVMLSSLAGTTLGVWISHGEGKFSLPKSEDAYNVVAKYGYAAYPANPNGSDYNVAMLASKDGRHLATMPHIERSFYAWNWAHYPSDRSDKVSPWAEAFVNARKWCEK